MSRRSRNNGLLLAAGLALYAPGVASAAPKPLIMGPLYAEPARPANSPAPPGAGGCPVQIVELVDSRRAPETVGAAGIQAPADRDAWVRSVVEVGLAARGFKPSFGSEAVADAVNTRIRVRAVWVSLLQMNKVGSAVLQASAATGAAPTGLMKVYRGDRTSVNMWGSQSEFNELINQVFAEALDGLAADLRPLCPGGAGTPAQP